MERIIYIEDYYMQWANRSHDRLHIIRKDPIKLVIFL